MWDRPGLRPARPGRLLRPGDRDSDPALDGLRGQSIRGHHAARGADDDPRAGLYVADLVYALKEF